MPNLADALGVEIPVDKLTVPRARRVAELLNSGKLSYARLKSCRTDSTTESVIFEVDVEIPTHPVHAIKGSEEIAAVFRQEDRRPPECLSLRSDFPRVPHLNLGVTELPRSLCLYDQPWHTVRMTWTAASFVERIRYWLAHTARGELHGADQPLEPILLLWEHPIVLPARLFEQAEGTGPNRLLVSMTSNGGPLDPPALLAFPLGHPRAPKQGFKLVAASFKCQPQSHGVIRSTPATLEDLHAIAQSAGLDLVTELRTRLKSWHGQQDVHPAHLAIIVWFPKTRSAGTTPEANDVWAFVIHETIEVIGTRLAVWQRHDKTLGLVMGETAIPDSRSLKLSLLNPMSWLTPDQAAKYNGLEAADNRKGVAIGCGSLGSQVLLNLARSGFGKWTIVDNDRLFPHNLARHALDGSGVGHHKATVLAVTINSLTDGEHPATSLVADVLDPGESQSQLQTAFDSASHVLDLSASVPVARALVHQLAPQKRKCSAFLNPSGTELVLLVEDQERTVPLDLLEHQLYRAVLNNPQLERHFHKPDGWLRYAHSCRDVSSRLPHDSAALFGAVASRAIRTALGSPSASISVWQSSPDLSVTKIDIPTSTIVRHNGFEWTIATDRALLDRIASLRSDRLPNETGGVLLGSFDLERKIAYIVDTIPSPPDSGEWPTGYIRGAKKLLPTLKKVGERSGHMLQYVGEWHSHPDGYSCRPSGADCVVFAWLTELMDRDGFPAIMLIAGERGTYVPFLCKMVEGQLP
ncbi:MAG: ThiF family adenylyltransferase [Planctomycetes bacterium]|nr:ThiF family adenylyltransferase [Planctomycetota bacterium]